MADLCHQGITSIICNVSSTLAYYGKHNVMAGECHNGACHQVGVGCDTGSYKLFCVFMDIWHPPKGFFQAQHRVESRLNIDNYSRKVSYLHEK